MSHLEGQLLRPADAAAEFLGRRGGEAAEPRALPGPAVLVIGALTTAVVAQGAYYSAARAVVVLILGVAALAAVWAHGWSGRPRLVLFPVCAALSAWAVGSAALGGDVTSAGPTILLLGGVAAVVAVCRRCTRAQRETLAGAALALGGLAAASGWIGVAWRIEPWALEDTGVWRAAATLTYANAAAGLLVPLALLALARLADRDASPLGALTACVLLVGAGATFSRAGALALAAGLAVLCALLGTRRTLVAAVPPALGASIALAGLTPSMVASSPPRPALALAALALGLAVTAALQRASFRTVATCAAVGAAALAGIGPLGHRDALTSRLTLDSPVRSESLSAALRTAADQPLTGAGPGQASLTWRTGDGRVAEVKYAHNEYLQVLAELGALGLAAVSLLLAGLAWTVSTGRRAAPSPGVWAGVVAALVALALHSGLDFLWHVPAIPLVGALLVGIAAPPFRKVT